VLLPLCFLLPGVSNQLLFGFCFARDLFLPLLEIPHDTVGINSLKNRFHSCRRIVFPHTFMAQTALKVAVFYTAYLVFCFFSSSKLVFFPCFFSLDLAALIRIPIYSLSPPADRIFFFPCAPSPMSIRGRSGLFFEPLFYFSFNGIFFSQPTRCFVLSSVQEAISQTSSRKSFPFFPPPRKLDGPGRRRLPLRGLFLLQTSPFLLQGPAGWTGTTGSIRFFVCGTLLPLYLARSLVPSSPFFSGEADPPKLVSFPSPFY